MRRAVAFVLTGLLGVAVFGCTMRPKTFVPADTVWAGVEIREAMTPDKAWEAVVDVLAKKFDLEMISREGKYVRTAWTYNWLKSGELTSYYRVRAIVKFSADDTRVDLKTEANYLDGDQWIVGNDTLLLQTVKTDIMGVVARTTK
jgi:hypothetical protein